MSLLDCLLPQSPPETAQARVVRPCVEPLTLPEPPPKPLELTSEQKRERRRLMNLGWTQDWKLRNREHVLQYYRDRRVRVAEAKRILEAM